MTRHALAAAEALIALAAPVSAAAKPPKWLQLENGVTTPQFALANAIVQRL
jgi:hypothetical protein